MDIIPITLVGDNLGKRHQYLNNKVNEAFESNVPFDSIKDLQEHSPIDRLFKIDLAIKHRNVDYILKTLKDEDMLFVKRAMKCKWLVQDPQYYDIIDPIALEEKLYPKMLTTASNIMKHWIQLNLKNEDRCKFFYEYYQSAEIDFALKFLPKCPVEYIIREIEWLPLNKLTPQFLKLLCEKSTKAAEVYFKKLVKDAKTDSNYMRHMQLLLKVDSDLYFYIIENVYVAGFKRLNKEATKYIMKHHRQRFQAKPELYAAKILNLSVIAKYLNSEELKQLIIKLARAEECFPAATIVGQFGHSCFGNHWLTYKFAEPLLKGVDTIERADFGAQIFEKKSFGDKVQELSYHVPSAPEGIFTVDAYDSDTEDYDGIINEPVGMCFGSSAGIRGVAYKSLHSKRHYGPPSSLDRLFDEFRFKMFSKTFNELQKRIRKESSPETRQNMLLVLVSRSGGRPEYIERLLELMVDKHINEPPNLRATIVRSLVRRAAVWRVPPFVWNMLLELTRDLGMDGTTPIADCHEGLHAVVLRHVLHDTPCPPAVWSTFLRKFSPFTEYSLNPTELSYLHTRLPILLINSAESEPETACERLSQLLDTLAAYRLSVNLYPRAITLVSDLYSRDPSVAKELLRRIFDSRVARKILFKENFQILQNDASYLNALRHDAGMLGGKEFEAFIESRVTELHHERFLRKLVLYFGDEGGLAVQYLKILAQRVSMQPDMRLARSIALLTGAASAQWPTLLKPEDELKEKAYRRMMSELRTNEHLSRPKAKLKLDSKDTSLKALANWLHTCSPEFLKSNMSTVLQQPRLARLVMALRAPKWDGLIAETLPEASKQRGVKAFCIALCMLRRYPNFLPQDWDALLSLIPKLNWEGKKDTIYRSIVKLNKVPRYIRPDYSLMMHQSLVKLDMKSKHGSLTMITLPLVECMSNNINKVDLNYIIKIVRDFLENDFTVDNVKKHDYYLNKYIDTHMKLIARFILGNNDQKLRLDEVCIPFLEKIKSMVGEERIGRPNKFSYFCTFLKHLKYTRLFLDQTESCLPALEAVQSFCDEVFPIYKNFGMNYGIRLNIVYRSAVKLSAKEHFDLFKDDELHKVESRNLIAFNFGKMVAEDVENLISHYFLSLRPIYCNYLANYLRFYFNRPFVCSTYTVSFIKGLINDESKLNGVLIGVSLYNKLFVDWQIARRGDEKTTQKELYESLTQIKAEKIKFFLNYSEICSCMGMNNCCL